MITQDLYNALHEKEFKQAEYSLAKALNESESDDSSKSDKTKAIEKEFQNISDSIFRIALKIRKNLSSLPKQELISEEKKLTSYHSNLHKLKQHYYAIIGQEQEHPNYSKAFTYLNQAWFMIVDEITSRRKE
ncbi:MAG: hypothetical protein ACP5OG_02930 [Candidatus Nanoarchaeia archaeon]